MAKLSGLIRVKLAIPDYLPACHRQCIALHSVTPTDAEIRLKRASEEAGGNEVEYGGPRSVTRLMALFDHLSRAPRGLTLADMNVALDSPKSSILNLLRPLLAEGYIVHDGQAYHLGPSMFRLAASMMGGWNFPRLIRPFLTELSTRTEETAVLSLLDRKAEAVTYVEIIEGSHPIRYHIPVGTIRPILTTAAGRIMLAHADAAWRNTFIGSVKFPIAGLVPVSKATLLKELAEVLAEGVSISLDRHIPDVSAVAAPVFNADGRCIAALTVAGPSERFRRNLDTLVITIKDVAAKASGAIISGSPPIV